MISERYSYEPDDIYEPSKSPLRELYNEMSDPTVQRPLVEQLAIDDQDPIIAELLELTYDPEDDSYDYNMVLRLYEMLRYAVQFPDSDRTSEHSLHQWWASLENILREDTPESLLFRYSPELASEYLQIVMERHRMLNYGVLANPPFAHFGIWTPWNEDELLLKKQQLGDVYSILPEAYKAKMNFARKRMPELQEWDREEDEIEAAMQRYTLSMSLDKENAELLKARGLLTKERNSVDGRYWTHSDDDFLY